MSYAEPVAAALLRAALADLAARYGGGDDEPIDAREFEPPQGQFLVAQVGSTPAGCGGWRSLRGTDGVAEIKRMYVEPAFRGLGVATAILRALEDSARRHGKVRVVLETGATQPEAIALYRKLGYVRIQDYGRYRGAPQVRSFGRDLI